MNNRCTWIALIVLFAAACTGRADRYACVINEGGFCIFTGTPHSNGLEPGTEQIVNRDGEVLFPVSEALAVNASGAVLDARGTPAMDGDLMAQGSQAELSDDARAFHRVMAIMFPIRNALMYDIETLTQERWDALVAELTRRNIKETTFTQGARPPSRHLVNKFLVTNSKKYVGI
mgnify:CR=1 FL=1